MDLRLTFNEEVAKYDKYRPKYCDELFSQIFTIKSIDQNSTIVEIGCGTGQATEPFLKTNCNLTAIEYGSELASYVKDKFSDYLNFEVLNCKFEDAILEKNSVDLIFSATAFHWIKEDIGYPKAFELLKDKGILAVFWNRPIVCLDDLKYAEEVQKVYQKYFPNSQKPLPIDQRHCDEMVSKIASYGFNNVKSYMYHKTRSFNAEDYIELLNTYSDHIALPNTIKEAFESDLKDVISSHQNLINIFDTMDLYLARK